MNLKTRFKLFSAGWWLLSFALGAAPAARASEKVFRAGAHAVDISPTNFPVIVNAMFTERSATNIVEPRIVETVLGLLKKFLEKNGDSPPTPTGLTLEPCWTPSRSPTGG